MTYDRFLNIAGAWAAIATALVALFAYGRFLFQRYERRRRLEQHLKQEKDTGEDRGQRSTMHLMRNLRMTESEVLEAAFHSEVVQCRTSQDDQGRATVLWFEYDDSKPATGQASRRKF